MERFGFFFASDSVIEPGDFTYLHATLYEMHTNVFKLQEIGKLLMKKFILNY